MTDRQSRASDCVDDDNYLGVTTHQFYAVQASVLRQLVRAFRHRRHRDQDQDDRSDRE